MVLAIVLSLAPLTAKAAVATKVTVSPSSLTFGGQMVGATSSTQLVTIKNTGSAALIIPKAFTISGDFTFGGLGTCAVGVSYAPRSSCTASVKFTPTASGTRTGTLTIFDNAGNGSQTVPLMGTGLLASPSPSPSPSPKPSPSPSPIPSSSPVACTYYIAPTGSDSSGNGSISSPWDTINYASAKLSPGQTLCARGGTYYGQGGYVWHSSGTSSAPITFRNYPGETPVFDGQWGKNPNGGVMIAFQNNSYVVMDGITVQHYVDCYGDGAIVFVGPNSNMIVQNCTFQDNGTKIPEDHNIYVGASNSNITIRNNYLVRAPGSGVQAYHTPGSNGVQIYNNVIVGGALTYCPGTNFLNCPSGSPGYTENCKSGDTALWGIVLADGSDFQVYNNTIYGMQRGIDFYYYSTGATGTNVVENNLIVNSTEFGLRVGSADVPYFSSDYNDFYGNRTDVQWNCDISTGSCSGLWTLAQFAANTTNDHHSISGNPSFVSPGSNFQLGSGSPALTGGTNFYSLFETDFLNDPRPQSGSWSIGAYQY